MQRIVVGLSELKTILEDEIVCLLNNRLCVFVQKFYDKFETFRNTSFNFVLLFWVGELRYVKGLKNLYHAAPAEAGQVRWSTQL
jgi:hypothetical protein